VGKAYIVYKEGPLFPQKTILFVALDPTKISEGILGYVDLFLGNEKPKPPVKVTKRNSLTRVVIGVIGQQPRILHFVQEEVLLAG
jgi:hypothetical protein